MGNYSMSQFASNYNNFLPIQNCKFIILIEQEDSHPQFNSREPKRCMKNNHKMRNQRRNTQYSETQKPTRQSPRSKSPGTSKQQYSFQAQTDTSVCDIQYMPNKLKMLYIDVLCRGYHPVKGFETSAKNVFKQYELEEDPGKLKKFVKLINVANNEAIATIWRCLAREIGKPLKNYNMKNVSIQLNKELQKLRTENGLSKSQVNYYKNDPDMDEYKKVQQKLSDLQQKIKEQMNKISERCRQDEQKTKQMRQNIVKVMQQQILNLEKQIFIKSVIGIRQFNDNTDLVQFVMEQCYPNINTSAKKAKQALGAQLFDQKWIRYRMIQEKYSITNQAIMIVCHRCLIPLQEFGRVGECNDTNATREVGYTVLTDPYTYSRQIINENCWEQDSRRYIHPYLTYYPFNDNDTYICNRYFCNKCEGSEISLNREGLCGYCEGTCDCSRCQGMDSLTKMMAVFIDNGGNLQNVISKFMMKFDTKKLQTTSKKTMKPTMSQFRQYRNFFSDNKIIIDRGNLEKFQKIYYFSERIEEDVRVKYQKIKMRKFKLNQSESTKKDRLDIIAQRNLNQQLKTRSLMKQKADQRNKKNAQHPNKDKLDSLQKKGDQNPTNGKTDYRDNASENQKQQKSKQPIDCYYQDSDS